MRLPLVLAGACLLGAVARPVPADDGGAAEAVDLSPLPESAFTLAHAAHLLRRAGFGGTPDEVAALHARGAAGAVAWLVDTRAIPDPSPPFRRTLDGPPPKAEMVGLSEEERRAKHQAYQRADHAQLWRLRAWWLDRMVRSPRPLEERMTLFWHGHFCSGHRDVKDSALMDRQHRLLRAHALGNFGTFVRAVARDPAMLEYLDNRVNRREHPNENFARELMELFTLGVGHYTEQDIKEAARAFTGWTCQGDAFEFRPPWHDAGVKTVCGVTGRLDGDRVIDILLAQPAAGEWIAGKLFRTLAHDGPSPEVVRELGRGFRESGYAIAPLVARILRSRAFFSARARGTMIRSPIDLVVGTLRAMGAPGIAEPAGLLLSRATEDLGQALFEPPNVKGWPGGRDWISTSTLLARYNVAVALAASAREREFQRGLTKRLARRLAEASGAGGGEDPEGHPMPGMGDDPAPGSDAETWVFDVRAAAGRATTADAAIDALAGRFLAVPCPAALRAELRDYLRAPPLTAERLHGALQLLLSTPEAQLQ